MVQIAVPECTTSRGNSFNASIEWNSSSFDRMKHAVKRLATVNLIDPIRQMLLGQHTSDEVNKPKHLLREE